MFVRKRSCNSSLQSITILLLCALSNQIENKHNNASNIFKSYVHSTQMRDKVRLNDSSFYKNVDKLDLNGKLNASKQTNVSQFDGILPKSLLFANSSNSSTLDAFTLMLSLLANGNSSENESNITSESRTLSSWLGLKRFRRPNKQRLHTRPLWQSMPPHPHYHRIQHLSDHQLLNMLPRPEGFPAPNDANAILLPPNLFEDSGIKYWLQFIENGGNADKVQIDFSQKPIIERFRKPANVPLVYSKPIEIGEKPTDNEEFFNDEEEYNDDNDYDHKNGNNEKNTEPNYSNIQTDVSPQETQKFDTSPRCDKFTTDICVDDFEYPEQAIVDEIYKRKDVFELMYSEVKDNVPLVDGIPRDVEESYNYDYYFNDNKDPQASGSEYGKQDKRSPSGFVCPSEVLYGKPKLARNKKGEWKVIVNAAEFTQTVRMEKCFKPNSKCNYISYPDYNSRCAQVHSFHRLMVFEKGKGFYIDTFRIPTACSCHVNRRTINYKPIKSSSENSEIQHDSKPPALSNTLWSILGGSPKTIANSQELIQNQINLLQQMKHLPQQFQISPENVIKQLMDMQPNALSMPQTNLNHLNPHNSSPMFFNPQSMQNSAQNNLDYFIPNVMMNEDFQESGQIQDQRGGGGSIAVHQSPGTTTYVNPNGNGAPVVQVIHVPVTAGISPNSQHMQPVFSNNRTPAYSGYSYLDANSLFARNKPTIPHNSADIYSSFEDSLGEENFRPMLLEMSTKTNSSLLPPDNRKSDQSVKDLVFSQRHNASTKEEPTDKSDKRKGIMSSTLNRKINFSYHPIFEYISN